MKKISNISSVALPFRAANPSEIFIEIKDNTHPLILVRGGLCPIGGNWIGDAAANDRNPLATVRRELLEELTLESKGVSTEELVQLGLTDRKEQYQAFRSSNPRSSGDQFMIAEVVAAIGASLTPFGSYLNTTPKEAIQSADPGSNREGFTTLCCYWLAPLDEPTWMKLKHLQAAYANLSNESITVLTSLDEILERSLSGAFVHEQPLCDFFRAMGFPQAREMRIVDGQTSQLVGPALPTYAEYLNRYDIAKKPVATPNIKVTD